MNKSNGSIGVCVIGAGRAGMIHAKNFVGNVPGAHLVAVVDPNKEIAKAACNELGIEHMYESYEHALSNKNIDAYVVVAPTSLHSKIVVDLASEGKHVLCEKPMAMSIKECDDMIAAAEKNKTILQIGFMRRFDTGFKRAYEIVQSGAIGDVVMIRSNTRGPSVPRPWMYNLQDSNGPLAEVNSHDIDTLRWFSGSEFDTVYAIGGNFRCPDAVKDYPDFYDNVVLNCRFKNNMQGVIDGAQGVEYAYDSRTEILGVKGCIFVGRVHDDVVLTCTGGVGQSPVVDSWRNLFKDAYLNEDISFINCINKGTVPEVTGHDGRMAVAVVNAGNTSIVENRIVKL